MDFIAFKLITHLPRLAFYIKKAMYNPLLNILRDINGKKEKIKEGS